MTIDEAIAHCKEKSNCSECGKEHEQLAVWLAELQTYKNLKEQGRLIEMPCDDESEKYRWHDLRKNPDDLPEDLHKVLIHIKGYEDYSGVDMAMHHKFTGIWSTIFASYKDEEVIAWREIEPFEEK